MAWGGNADSDSTLPSRSGPTWQEKLRQAHEYKKQGNEKYSSNLYKAAIGKYHRALLYLKGIDQISPLAGLDGVPSTPKPPEHVLAEVKRLRTDCLNNLSACLLKLEKPNYQKILQYSEDVLQESPQNLKALYRKGVALFHLGNADDAIRVLEKASQLPEAHKDANIKRYLGLCRSELQHQESRMKKTYKSMFEQLAAEDTSSNQNNSLLQMKECDGDINK